MGDDQQSVKEETQGSDAQGDVAVIQPSFDDDGFRKKPSEMSDDKCSSPNHRGGHKQNLSEHFQDATNLSNGSPAKTGQKHSRAYSGDASNPAQAHRRIDSVGKSAAIKRAKPHRRIDSSGLDALTAAADFSREELQASATGRHSWNNHPNFIRRSPIETTFDHTVHGPAPPSHQQPPPQLPGSVRSPMETATTFDHTVHGSAPPPHQQPPPQLPGAAHHRHYSLNSSGGLPARTVYYTHPSYPQPPYHPAYHYPPHPVSNGYPRHHGPPHGPPPPASYPVQYARPRGQDPYTKHHTPLQQPTLERPHSENPARTSPTVASIDHKHSAVKVNETMGPPAPHQWPRGGSTQGVQTVAFAYLMVPSVNYASIQDARNTSRKPDYVVHTDQHENVVSWKAVQRLLYKAAVALRMERKRSYVLSTDAQNKLFLVGCVRSIMIKSKRAKILPVRLSIRKNLVLQRGRKSRVTHVVSRFSKKLA
ncbi:unnamed protein product [Pseudo-nitzschia multistriata]|uniref:Uncharacterized protein n=1 Tax=Pseudo-nitzschia multistriata TaxID=183589 RepID=A0A448Z209_9STRA|nr:unnamed protein product [Pseudo-nitzschia multistriata]